MNGWGSTDPVSLSDLHCCKPKWYSATGDAHCLFSKQTQFFEIPANSSLGSTHLFVLRGTYWMIAMVEIRGGGAEGSCVWNLILVRQSESERKTPWAVNRIWPLLLVLELNSLHTSRGKVPRQQGDCFCN